MRLVISTLLPLLACAVAAARDHHAHPERLSALSPRTTKASGVASSSPSSAAAERAAIAERVHNAERAAIAERVAKPTPERLAHAERLGHTDRHAHAHPHNDRIPHPERVPHSERPQQHSNRITHSPTPKHHPEHHAHSENAAHLDRFLHPAERPAHSDHEPQLEKFLHSDRPHSHPTAKPIAILSSHQITTDEFGSHSSAFEAENGIQFEFSGSQGIDGGANMIGSYSYPMEDGSIATFNFVADENGYQPQSDLLPVAPAFPHPIPQFVLEQIEFARLQDERKSLEGHPN
ncbi:endocuticle structural glycoprotein SgAbd-1-like [Macrobrachium rosenbergii]|uniref:endocuticle structural glycoprotein SgAbd-1-like n=1 Tax=Macrobrachium rosenbergii TaxID=79674 RepID=UPI0034D6C4E8